MGSSASSSLSRRSRHGCSFFAAIRLRALQKALTTEDVLKKCFFGKPFPPSAERLKLALAEVNKPDALERLRARPSFARFEQQARAWLFATP